jgi:RND family efflux transporter MFP subunit
MIKPPGGAGEYMVAKRSVRSGRGIISSLAAGALLFTGTLRASAADESVFPGFTKPSAQRDVTFNGPGVVSEEPVKEGDLVKAGELLAVQDSTVEEATEKVAEIEANSDLQIEAAKADHDAKVVEMNRKEEMRKENVVGQSELDEAKVNEVIAAIRIRLAEQEKEKAMAEAMEEQSKIKLKRLTSPVSGVVAKVNTHVGEAASSDVTKPIMTIIQNDPLYVEVDLPTMVVKNIRAHQMIEMRYVGDEKWTAAEAIFVAPEADARSDRQKVRLQLPNPQGRQSGLQVQVKAPENVAAVPAADDSSR